MITPDYCATIARYNQWQNAATLKAAGQMDGDALALDWGAFFGSIIGTFSHLLWADGMWMSRLSGGAASEGGIAGSAT